MSRLDWENGVRRLQRNVDPNHQSRINNSTGHTPGTSNDWDTFYKYPDNEPHGSLVVDVGQERLSPQNKQLSQVEDQDGELLEMDSEDPELARKRKELSQIEEQIVQKKVALALKRVEPFVKKTMPGVSCNEEAATCIGETLRDRVNAILQQRQSFVILKKSPRQRITLSSLRKDSLQQEDHPLKLRVKALIKQRCADPCLLPTTTERENGADKGFQRFLSILNEGVDMDFLSRIVNDDSEDLPSGGEQLNIQPPTAGNKPSHFMSESQQSNSSSSLPGCSQTSSGEGKVEPTGHNEGLSLLNVEEKKNDRGDGSRSKSPTAVKKKKEEVENPKFDEQREQLQNILKTLGLNLEVEEMSKLADRTQERLYGKKHEGRQSRTEQESQQQRASHRHYRNSSSSSSSSSFSSRCSSSSSRSTSRSCSPSLSRSHSRDSKPRWGCERSCSRDGGRDVPKKQGSSQDSKEPHKLCKRDERHSPKIFSYQHPSSETYPHRHPEDFSSFPRDPWSQCSQSTTLDSGKYSTNTNSFWTYSQGAAPTPLCAGGFLNQQNAYHHIHGPDTVYSNHTFEDMNLLVNPDLSTSEGQTGVTTGPRCLQVISTTRSAPKSLSQRTPFLKQLTKGHKRRMRDSCVRRYLLFKERKKQEKFKKRQQKMTEDQSQESVQTLEVSQENEAEQSEDVKQQPTEEEIKANLRKKLEAFNQRAKQKLPQPAASQLLKSVECQDCL